MRRTRASSYAITTEYTRFKCKIHYLRFVFKWTVFCIRVRVCCVCVSAVASSFCDSFESLSSPLLPSSRQQTLHLNLSMVEWLKCETTPAKQWGNITKMDINRHRRRPSQSELAKAPVFVPITQSPHDVFLWPIFFVNIFLFCFAAFRFS